MTVRREQNQPSTAESDVGRLRYQRELDWIDTCLSWLLRRRWFCVLRGLPALVVFIALALLALRVCLQSPAQRRSFYQRSGLAAFEARDYVRAALVYERLTMLQPEALEPRFRWALAANELGETALVESLLETVAPSYGIGYAPAHLWQARRLLAGTPDESRLWAAERHLRRVLYVYPDAPDAHAALGELCQATGRPLDALTHLLKAAPARPELELAVAKLYTARGEAELAVFHARRAQEHYRQLSETDPTQLRPRFNWAEATLLAGAPAQAVAILEDGGGPEPNLQFRAALARIYLAWFDLLAREKPDDLAARLALLDQALKYQCGNTEALGRLLALGRDPRLGASLPALLQEDPGESAGLVHLLLGMRSAAGGTGKEARARLSQAYQLQPDLALVANNLAWVLARLEPPDLAQALCLIDSVLERWPQEARYRDTRGRILTRIGRWQEARSDLEAALAQMPNDRALHATLAQTYRQLGMPEKAQQHERLAPPAQP